MESGKRWSAWKRERDMLRLSLHSGQQFHLPTQPYFSNGLKEEAGKGYPNDFAQYVCGVRVSLKSSPCRLGFTSTRIPCCANFNQTAFIGAGSGELWYEAAECFWDTEALSILAFYIRNSNRKRKPFEEARQSPKFSFSSTLIFVPYCGSVQGYLRQSKEHDVFNSNIGFTIRIRMIHGARSTFFTLFHSEQELPALTPPERINGLPIKTGRIIL